MTRYEKTDHFEDLLILQHGCRHKDIFAINEIKGGVKNWNRVTEKGHNLPEDGYWSTKQIPWWTAFVKLPIQLPDIHGRQQYEDWIIDRIGMKEWAGGNVLYKWRVTIAWALWQPTSLNK